MSREQIEQLVTSLQRGTQRLTRLIDNLLESVRIESGQLAIRRQAVDLAQVVEDAEQMLEGLLAQRRQTLRVELPPDLPVVPGDAQRLAQVFTNLIANANNSARRAARFTSALTRALARSPSGWRTRDPAYRTGWRVDLERFYRSADQEPEPRGLGLGLWIVKSIVERHGGGVRVERTAAGRTRFAVTLPAGEVGA